MGCIQAYFKKAQSGLSPSSTLEQEPAEIITEENVSGRASEKISCSAVTEDEEGTEDDDPDKSQGVRATAVLTLAASTGTVAILGTTAQPLPTDLSDTTLNTVQNLEIEDSHINHLDHTHERHIPLKDSIDLDDKHQEVEKLIEYTQEPKRIFSEKAISDSNNISNGGINQKTIPPQPETTSVTDVTPDSPDVTISAPEAKDTPDVTISEVKDSASDVTISEAKDSVTDVTEKEVTITSEVKDAPVCSRVPELTVTSDSSDNVAVDESDVTDTEPRSESEAANLLEHEVSEETSSPLVIQQLELEEKSSSPSTADSDVTMQKESKTEKDVSDTSISIDEKTETHTNEYNLIENEDSSESVTHSLGTKLNFSEVLNPEKEVTEAVNQRLSSLVRGISEDEMPTTVLELTKDYVNGVDVWREDNNLTKDLGNEYIERVKLKAEDLVNEICAKAETVNQNGLAKDIVTSVNFAKANSVDSYRPPLAETKLKTSMTSSFEDALLNVNFGEGAEAPTFCPRLSTIGSELELKVAEELSPVDKSGSSFSDGDLSPDPKGLSDSVIETIKGEIAEICEEAADRAAQLLAEKAAEEAESDSNEISENGTSTNNPSISFSDDTQIIESSIHAPVDEKLASAATTIQASFRGYQVRKAHKKQENPRTESTVVDEDELPPPDMELLGSEGDTISEEDLPQPPEFDDLPLPEDLAELDEYVVTPEIRDQMVRRNTIIAETRLSGLSAASMNESSSEIDSSLSSAATKIQAGIRGYLTRKHLKNTSSTTAPSMDDSDLSTGEPNQIKKALSVEETEIQRHPFSPDEKYMVGKRMSLDSRINPSGGSRGRAPMRSTMSECADDRDQWFVGSEAEEKAAARIQSGYRGYKTRQRLKRGDAVQQPTTSSSVTPASASPATAASPRTHSAASDEPPTPKHTGEYHDVLALSPPVLHSVVEEDADGDESSESDPKKGASEAELVDAAIKIQSVFRGYKTRKELNEGDSRTETESLDSTQTEPMTEPKKTSEPTPAEGEEDPDVNEANATKIQAHIRGYLTRKQLEEKREAAVKIQDNFRKYNARKKAKNQN